MANILPITINGYSLDSSASVMAAMTTHDSAPMTDLSMVKISRRDGAKITNAQYAEKRITITGQLLLGTQSDFEQTADSFKRSVEVQQGQLNIPYASGTRQYNVWTSGVTISRDSDNIEYAPYTLDLVAADPPFGTDLAYQTFYSASNITTAVWSSSVYFGGSAAPKPLVTIGVSSGSFLTGLQLNTALPATSLIFSDSQFTAGNSYQFDTNTFLLTRNGAPLDYSGQWSQFTQNQWNGVSIQTTATQGNNIDQQNLSAVGGGMNFNSVGYLAQSFTPSLTAARVSVDLNLAAAVGDTAPITIELRTSSGSYPSTTVLATGTMAGAGSGIFNIPFNTSPTLTAGLTYWYVLSRATTQNVSIPAQTGTDTYNRGAIAQSNNSGTTWVTPTLFLDTYFRDWYQNGTPASNLNISFQGSNRWL